MRDISQIIIANYHESTSLGITTFLQAHTNASLLSACSSIAEVSANINDVAILIFDIKNNAQSDICAIGQLIQTYPGIRVIAFIAREELYTIRHLLTAGVHACVSQSSGMQELLDAIYIVSNGSTCCCPAIQRLVKNADFELSELQESIVRLTLQGKTDIEIGKIIFRSPRTIESSRVAIRAKLRVKNNAGMIYTLMIKGFYM